MSSLSLASHAEDSHIMSILKSRRWLLALFTTVLGLVFAIPAHASEANLLLPDLNLFQFHGIGGHALLSWGLLICIAGLVFGLYIYTHLRNLPVHKSMLEISELIYATCKTYLLTQIKFILVLEAFIAVILVAYFGFLATDDLGAHYPPAKVAVIVIFSLVGIAGSCSVAAFGIRINTFANSRTALASLAGKPFPVYAIPLQAGMSIGMVLISVELIVMLGILLFLPNDYAGVCFIGFAVGESLGAAALRVAGGIFTKIADIGADLMKIVFNVKEDDARNPGVIADCTGDNAGDSVGPTADGFETYGVTGVALITFILLAVHADTPKNTDLLRAALLVWIFAMRLVMVISSGVSYLVNAAIARLNVGQRRQDELREAPHQPRLARLRRLHRQHLPRLLRAHPQHRRRHHLVEALHHHLLRHSRRRNHPRSHHLLHLHPLPPRPRSRHRQPRRRSIPQHPLRPHRRQLQRLLGRRVVILGLMAGAYAISTQGLHALMSAEAVFAFGLVAFGFLGMGPVTIAVDSYGPVTDNAQSVYELSLIETIPNIREELKRDFNIDPDFERAKHLLEENDGAGNTFKATAKPVLIGTAVVGATTMIFSIIMVLTESLTTNMSKLSILHAPFLLGLLAGGAIIYWFTGASMQAVITGAYRAVAYIKRHMKLDGADRASMEDSKRVVEICTKYAQAGMFNIFLTVFFMTLAAAFTEPFFFIGFLIGLAFFGLFQAIFMANAGGAWDNAKKIVEVELREKGTPLHEATVVGDTVGDPFKDTSSVALNPIIKFSTLFGLLAVELALKMELQHPTAKAILAAAFFLVGVTFVYRSFYGMRIGTQDHDTPTAPPHQTRLAQATT